MVDFSPLFAAGADRSYNPGETIITPGGGAEHVYLLREGRVRVSRYSADGREITLALVGPGELLGEMALLDGGDRSATAVALTGVVLTSLNRPQFLQAVKDKPDQAMHLIGALCQRLRRADEMVEELTFLGVKERLRSLIRRYQAQGEEGLLAALTHQEIAEMIGTSRESVTRALTELRREKNDQG